MFIDGYEFTFDNLKIVEHENSISFTPDGIKVDIVVISDEDVRAPDSLQLHLQCTIAKPTQAIREKILKAVLEEVALQFGSLARPLKLTKRGD